VTLFRTRADGTVAQRVDIAKAGAAIGLFALGDGYLVASQPAMFPQPAVLDRLRPDLSVDATSVTRGRVAISGRGSQAIAWAGKILVSASDGANDANPRLVRFTPGGVLDTSFASAGIFAVRACGMAEDPQGRLIVVDEIVTDNRITGTRIRRLLP